MSNGLFCFEFICLRTVRLVLITCQSEQVEGNCVDAFTVQLSRYWMPACVIAKYYQTLLAFVWCFSRRQVYCLNTSALNYWFQSTLTCVTRKNLANPRRRNKIRLILFGCVAQSIVVSFTKPRCRCFNMTLSFRIGTDFRRALQSRTHLVTDLKQIGWHESTGRWLIMREVIHSPYWLSHHSY